MAEKQGEVKKISQKEPPEFKGAGEEGKKEMNPPPAPPPAGDKKKTSVITMQGGKPRRIYFEDGKQVRMEDAK